MMIIETAYDEFNSVVDAALTAHGLTLTPVTVFKELEDNIIIENNDEKKLKSGYCIQFSSDQNTNRDLSCLTGIEHTVYVTFTTANYGTIRDITKRKEAEKRLLAAKDAVMKAIGGNPQLNDKVGSCIYDGSDPVELIIDDTEKLYLMIRSTYKIEYFEQST